MNNAVNYILGLQSSQFETGIDNARLKTNALDSSFATLQSSLLKFASGFAAFEFLKGSVSMYNESAQASAQLDASLRSTANAANLNREALDKQAESLMKKSLFDDDAITKSQALLATFTNVKDAIFMDAIPAITDMATKMGGDLQGATIQVGKALNDPIRGITALRRVGVDFNDTQVETIKHLVETNQTAQAQALILNELTKEFGGSALAASEAGTGPFQVLSESFNNVREELGKLIVDLALEFRPEIENGVHAIANIVKWLGENKQVIKDVAVGYGAYQLAMITIVPLIQGFSAATVVATAETTALAAEVTLATGGLNLIAVALAAVAVGYYNYANAKDNALDQTKRNAARNAKELTDEMNAELKLRMERKENADSARKEIAKRNEEEIKYDLSEAQKALAYAQDRKYTLDQNGFTMQGKAFDEQIEIAQSHITRNKAELEAIQAFKSAGVTKLNNTAIGKAGTDNKPPTISKATGSKNVTINISIKDFGAITINATTVKDSVGRITEHLHGALAKVLNDSQLIVQ